MRLYSENRVPSIDRIDSNGHYELGNMRIMPNKDNMDEGRRSRWAKQLSVYASYQGDNFGRTLKCYRARKGLTQRSLSVKCGISFTHINSYESGRMIPNLINMVKIGKAIDMSFDEFFSRVNIVGGQGIKKEKTT
jgi:DNA-binding XRE family transcriptional regulator